MGKGINFAGAMRFRWIKIQRYNMGRGSASESWMNSMYALNNVYKEPSARCIL
jgi:hypothetical protein